MATIREEEPEAYLYKRQAINACFQSRSTSLKAITGLTPHLWVHGEPGAFKSVFAHTNWPEHYDKSPNDKWWCGYAHQDVVLLDDVGLDARHMATDYKRWLDRTPFVAQPKGSSMVIRPGRVVVTSNYTPEEIFNATDAAAVRRRLSVVRLTSAMRGRIPGYERAQYYDPATGLAAPWPADDEPMPKPPAPQLRQKCKEFWMWRPRLRSLHKYIQWPTTRKKLSRKPTAVAVNALPAAGAKAASAASRR